MLDFLRRWLHNKPSLTNEALPMTQYTDAMVARLKASAPLNLEKAHALSAEFGGVTYRSVISKAKSLGIEYVKASAPARKRIGPSKADICSAIEQAMGLELPGLDKAPAATLGLILEAVTNEG